MMPDRDNIESIDLDKALKALDVIQNRLNRCFAEMRSMTVAEQTLAMSSIDYVRRTLIKIKESAE